MSDRTFVVDHDKPMTGNDVKAWQQSVKKLFKDMGIDCPIKTDGVFGPASRAFTADLVYAMGMAAKVQLKNGVTPQLRKKLRDKDLTLIQRKSMKAKSRTAYRARLRDRWSTKKVHAPVSHILTDSWGFHPGVHDGEDVITDGGVPTFAMVKCKVIDVRASGWWGLGAPSDPALKARGDGIVQMEVLENVGPFKKGMHIGYGHNENAVVKVGQVLKAGDHVASVGFANAWHIHLMINDGKVGTRGVGNLDPRKFIDYAVKNG